MVSSESSAGNNTSGLEQYNAVAHSFERNDPEIWELVGCNPAVVSLESAREDIAEFLGTDVYMNFLEIYRAFEISLYDRLK